jgi:Zn-dependent protease
MLGNVSPTPYDLRFSLFGIPVRVHPFFWLFSAMLSWVRGSLALTALLVACVFVSILVHELGHALSAQYYRWRPEIVLYSFGGYASYIPVWGHSTARSILVTFAGPGAGFVLCAAVYILEETVFKKPGSISGYGRFALHFLRDFNLWINLANLLPVYPLDGGQICRSALTHFRPREGFEISLKISLVIAVGMAWFCLQYGRHHHFPFDPMFTAILFGALAFDNLQSLQGGRFR